MVLAPQMAQHLTPASRSKVPAGETRSGYATMVQDVDLFLAIAEISGVFVGFGALISFTRRNEIQAVQLGQIRAVVTIGLVVIVAALLPVGLSRYGVTGHGLWFTSSLIFLILVWAVTILSLRRPENRQVMMAQTREDDIGLFARIANHQPYDGPEAVPFSVLMPAFLTSELKTAFQIGFILFIPFLIIDLVVASVLMAMGMMMLSPLIISLPFKLMLFVLVDGWSLVVGTLAASFVIN